VWAALPADHKPLMAFDAPAGRAYFSGMIRLAIFCLGLLVAAPQPALAAGADVPQEQAAKAPQEPTLDELFAKLAAAGTPEASRPVEHEILRRLHASGSDTVDLLFGWAMQAMQANAPGEALDLLDRVIIMKPDFAEAWNKRATVHFMMKDYGKSITDIERTLALEPRHFGALTGLGFILRDVGEKDRAIEILRRALAIHPQMKNVRDILTEMETEAAGRPI
jgi:tetratricopeptide (TPR) repeat protein